MISEEGEIWALERQTYRHEDGHQQAKDEDPARVPLTAFRRSPPQGHLHLGPPGPWDDPFLLFNTPAWQYSITEAPGN